jgi:hypothetical protein
MDLTKAQHLLLKIQAFLDNGNGHEISRLEKDLMKSYVIQLYDAISDESAIHHPGTKPFVETPQVIQQKAPAAPVFIPDPEPSPREIIQPVAREVHTPKPQPTPVEVKVPDPEPVYVAPKVEPKPVQIPVAPPVMETVHIHSSESMGTTANEILASLFEFSSAQEMAGMASHVPIESIESAMGLNERIFTLNDLFGGDKGLFDSTCAQLNSLHSFTEAKTVLMHGPAKQFNWADPKHQKMAEHFIRIVVRRYPKD